MNQIQKPVENWTKFPNCILDNLGDYTGSELKVLAFMVRKNLGYSNTDYRFSVRYLMLKTNMAKQTTITALKGLKAKGAIKHIGKGSGGEDKYSISWSEPKVQELDRSKNETTSGLKIRPEVVQKLDQEKEHYNKTIKERTTPIKELYNKHLLSIYDSQETINKVIFKSSKERQQYSLLMKKFESIQDATRFFDIAIQDKWLTDRGFIPSLLNSQYSSIVARSMLKPDKTTKPRFCACGRGLQGGKCPTCDNVKQEYV